MRSPASGETGWESLGARWVLPLWADAFTMVFTMVFTLKMVNTAVQYPSQTLPSYFKI